MNIKHPELLFLFVLIPAVLAFLYYVYKRRKEVLEKLCDISKVADLFPTSSKRKVLLRYILLIITMTMFVLALVSPRWGYEWQKVETKGTNIYIAIDTSKSMLAQDIKPNRITRAKLEMLKLLDLAQGDRIGLIIFAGEAFLQAPLTHDYLMIKEWLRRITVGSVPVEGTSVKAAVEMAMKGFQHIKSETKVLILISDGEEYDKETVEVVKRAKDMGIRIFGIGVGTNKGAPITDLDGGLVTDKNGEIVVSKLDDEFLRQISQESGGAFLRSTSGDFHIRNLYYDLIRAKLPSEELKSGKTKRWFETYQLFLGIGFFTLLWELLLTIDFAAMASLRRWLLSMKDKPRKKTLVILFFLFLVAQPAGANVFDIDMHKGDWFMWRQGCFKARDYYLKAQVREPDNPRLNYNLGICKYRDGLGEIKDPGIKQPLGSEPQVMRNEMSLERAVHHFKQAADSVFTSDWLKQKAFYNLGNAYVQTGKWKEAVESYKTAVKMDPDDDDAKKNLELTEEILKELNEKCPDDNKNKGDDKKDPKSDKKDQNDQQKKDQDKKDKEKQEQQKQDQQNQNYENLLRQVQDAPAPKPKQAGKAKQKDPDHWW